MLAGSEEALTNYLSPFLALQKYSPSVIYIRSMCRNFCCVFHLSFFPFLLTNIIHVTCDVIWVDIYSDKVMLLIFISPTMLKIAHAILPYSDTWIDIFCLLISCNNYLLFDCVKPCTRPSVTVRRTSAGS